MDGGEATSGEEGRARTKTTGGSRSRGEEETLRPDAGEETQTPGLFNSSRPLSSTDLSAVAPDHEDGHGEPEERC